VEESELILLGTDYDNEGKPIAYLGREKALPSLNGPLEL
jgi:DNA topoisomerase IA